MLKALPNPALAVDVRSLLREFNETRSITMQCRYGCRGSIRHSVCGSMSSLCNDHYQPKREQVTAYPRGCLGARLKGDVVARFRLENYDD